MNTYTCQDCFHQWVASVREYECQVCGSEYIMIIDSEQHYEQHFMDEFYDVDENDEDFEDE